jgi:HSP20 family molecular chaperone IbpA
MVAGTRRRAGDVTPTFRTRARSAEVPGDLGPWPWTRIALGPGAGWPAVDLIDRPGEVVVRADLPGLDRDAVQLTVEPRMLHLRGVREADADATPGDSYQCVERWSGPFDRTIRLPAGVDPDQSTVTLERGVLEVRLPKRRHATMQTLDVPGEQATPAAEPGPSVGDLVVCGPPFKEPLYAA